MSSDGRLVSDEELGTGEKRVWSRGDAEEVKRMLEWW